MPVPVQSELEPMGKYFLIRALHIDVDGVRLDKVINEVKSSIESIKTDYYTKQQADDNFAAKTDVYTKSEVDTALSNKVSVQSGYGLISDAEKAQIQTNKANITAAETAIAGKASQEEVNTIKSDVAGKASTEAVTQLQNDMAVQEARMDQLVGTVPEGSADEIADARIDNTGKTYANLGDHIRGTETSLKETIARITEGNPNLFDANTVTTGYRLGVDGGLFAGDGYFVSDFIRVSHGLTYTKNSPVADGLHRYAFFDANKHIFTTQKVSSENTITIDDTLNGVEYIRFCGERTEIENTIFSEGTEAVRYTALDLVAREANETLLKNAIKSSNNAFYSADAVKIGYNDVNNIPANEIVTYGISSLSAVENYPTKLTSGFTVVHYAPTSKVKSANVQLAVGLVNNIIAIRHFTNVWSDWQYINASVDTAEVAKLMYSVKADIFNADSLKENTIIDHATGAEQTSQYTSGYAVTDYIPVAFGDVIDLAYVRGANLCGGALYDSEKNFIKAIWGTDDFSRPSADFKAPFSFVVDSENIAYMRYNVVTNSLLLRDKQYIYKGNSAEYKNAVRKIVANSSAIHVGTSGDFTTLKDCTEHIVRNKIVGATVYVDPGTYDLVAEYGRDYLDSIQSDRNKGFGLHVGNNTHFIFSAGSKVIFDYNGNNSDCAEYFSPFNIIGSCILENADIEVRNARYCVHEDLPTSADSIPDSYAIKYINCKMKHNGATIPTGSHAAYTCIGAGTNKNSVSVIDGGKYEGSWTADISYHNYSGSAPSKVVLKNVWMIKGLRLADMSTSPVMVEVSGCYMPDGIIGTHTKFDVTSWNNQ